MNQETITAFNTFESLLSNAITTLHKSLQETHSLNAMYLDQFNDIIQFQQKTKYFTHFLQEENDYHNQRYTQFKSKMGTQSVSQLSDHSNNHFPKAMQSISEMFNKNNDSSHISCNQNVQLINSFFQSLTNEASNKDISADDIINSGEMDNDSELVSNNVSFNTGTADEEPITFIQYPSPQQSYPSIAEHPHYHPLVHGHSHGNQMREDIEGTLQDTAIPNGEPTFAAADQRKLMLQFNRDSNYDCASEIVAIYQNLGNVLLSLMKLKNRVNDNMDIVRGDDDNECVMFDGMVINLLNNNNMEVIKMFIDAICDIIMKSDKSGVICNELGKLLTLARFGRYGNTDQCQYVIKH